jgi:sec-independent protein translocase protein TatA
MEFTMVIAGMVGPWQVVLIIVALLFLFGGRKIPELMKGLGQGINEFKKSMKENDDKAKDKDEARSNQEELKS